MFAFRIKNPLDLLLIILAILTTIGLVFALPAWGCQLLWNAIAFEQLRGPNITLYQGLLLWLILLTVIILAIRPHVVFEVRRFPED